MLELSLKSLANFNTIKKIPFFNSLTKKIYSLQSELDYCLLKWKEYFKGGQQMQIFKNFNIYYATLQYHNILLHI